MKIFNWMQKRLHPNILKDGLTRNVKKTDSIAIDSNTKALMEQVAFVDVLDGWKDGILTIGTFGFDPLAKLEHKEYSASESDEEAEEGEGDALNNDDDHDNDEDEEVTPLMFSNMSQINNYDVALTPSAVIFPGTEIKLDHLDDQGKLRRRTTLAELFLEDSDMKKKPNLNEFTLDSGKHASAKTKNGSIFFAKKLDPHAREDSRPVKRIQKMMRRMLRRKIHPDIEGKSSNSKPDRPSKPSADQTTDAVSLLPTPNNSV